MSTIRKEATVRCVELDLIMHNGCLELKQMQISVKVSIFKVLPITGI